MRRRHAALVITASLVTPLAAPAGAAMIDKHSAVYASAMQNVTASGYTVTAVGNGALTSGIVYAETTTYDTGQLLWGRSEAAASPTGPGLLRAFATAFGQPGPNPSYGGVADAQAFWTDIAFTDGPVHPALLYGHVAVHGLLSSPSGGGSIFTNSGSTMQLGYTAYPLNLVAPVHPTVSGNTAELLNAMFSTGGWDSYTFKDGAFDATYTFRLPYDPTLGGYGFSLALRTTAGAKGGQGGADFFNTLDFTGLTLADGTPVPVHFDSGLQLTPVPEPSGVALLAIGLAAALATRRVAGGSGRPRRA